MEVEEKVRVERRYTYREKEEEERGLREQCEVGRKGREKNG